MPSQIELQAPTPSSVSFGDSSTNSFPFLTNGREKILPKYSAKPTEDFNEFVYKLRTFLTDPCIDNCHLDPSTTPHNAIRSKCLASLLGLCISGDAISPFINNTTFDDKGIEMFHHLFHAKYPLSSSTASSVKLAMSSTKILQKETMETFAKRLRSMYNVVTANGYPHDEDFLVRCFIDGLDSNFDATRQLLITGALDWYSHDLITVTQKAWTIQLNLQAVGTWFIDTSLAKSVGQQGARRPTTVQPVGPSTPSTSQDTPSSQPSATTTLPAFLMKGSGLSNRESEQCIRKFSCFLCRRNDHPFDRCSVASKFYEVTVKSTTPATSTTNNSSHNGGSQRTPQAHGQTRAVTKSQQQDTASSLPFTDQQDTHRFPDFEIIQDDENQTNASQNKN